jgi:hypothetical protein
MYHATKEDLGAVDTIDNKSVLKGLIRVFWLFYSCPTGYIDLSRILITAFIFQVFASNELKNILSPSTISNNQNLNTLHNISSIYKK